MDDIKLGALYMDNSIYDPKSKCKVWFVDTQLKKEDMRGEVISEQSNEHTIIFKGSFSETKKSKLTEIDLQTNRSGETRPGETINTGTNKFYVLYNFIDLFLSKKNWSYDNLYCYIFKKTDIWTICLYDKISDIGSLYTNCLPENDTLKEPLTLSHFKESSANNQKRSANNQNQSGDLTKIYLGEINEVCDIELDENSKWLREVKEDTIGDLASAEANNTPVKANAAAVNNRMRKLLKNTARMGERFNNTLEKLEKQKQQRRDILQKGRDEIKKRKEKRNQNVIKKRQQRRDILQQIRDQKIVEQEAAKAEAEAQAAQAQAQATQNAAEAAQNAAEAAQAQATQNAAEAAQNAAEAAQATNKVDISDLPIITLDVLKNIIEKYKDFPTDVYKTQDMYYIWVCYKYGRHTQPPIKVVIYEKITKHVKYLTYSVNNSVTDILNFLTNALSKKFVEKSTCTSTTRAEFVKKMSEIYSKHIRERNKKLVNNEKAEKATAEAAKVFATALEQRPPAKKNPSKNDMRRKKEQEHAQQQAAAKPIILNERQKE
jgi:hypothetical protein